VRHKAPFLLILLALICCLPAAAAAQDADLEGALRDLGLNDPQVTLEADRALVIYQQPVAEMGPIEAELERVARVLALFGDRLAPEAEVNLQQRFDDGQIMQVVGTPALGNAFLTGEIDATAFEMALRFEPLTRGPLIFEGTCNPAAGDTCETQEACACYPNESCQPADPAANLKGCLISTEPANAHLEGTEYACNDGHIWNLDMTGCEPVLVCPEGTQLMDGECVAPVAAEPTPLLADQVQVEETQEPLTGLLDPTWILWVGGAICLTGFLALLVIGILLVRRRKSRAKATPASTPATPAMPLPPTPATARPTPARPDPYDEAESRFRALQANYQSGAVDQATYQVEMKKLLVQDEEGRYWTLTKTGWHWYDGQRWVRADPPGRR
jgi:hypothetical protein